MALETGAAFTVHRDTKMLKTATQSEREGGRRVVALLGGGEGPRVPVRAKNVIVRICGLTVGGTATVDFDGEETLLANDGDHKVLGGKFAKVTTAVEEKVICEILIGT
jgi:phage gp45-like